MEFLREYLAIIRPVALALKTLEGNSHTFGVYYPTILSLRRKLGEANILELKFCGPLAIAIRDGFEDRFKHLLDLYDLQARSAPLFVAMMSNPKLKLNFLGWRAIPSHISTVARKLLFNAGREVLESEKKKGAAVADATIVAQQECDASLPNIDANAGI